MRIFIVFILCFLIILNVGSFSIPQAEYIKIKSISQNQSVFHGILKATNSTTLSFQSEGRIVFLPYTKGDFIKKNQVIARLDGILYSIKKNEEKAKLNEFIIQKQKQDKYYKRLDILHKEGAISDNDWENAFYELKTINQQIQMQKERIKYLDKEISYSVMLAPYDGYISEKYIDVGAYSKIGAPVVSFIASSGLQAEVMVDENYVNEIQKNQEVKILQNGNYYKGVVSHISKSNLNSGGYLVKIALLDIDKTAKEGMSADILFGDFSEDKIILPISCVFKKDNSEYVYKIVDIKNGQGKIIEQKVKIANILNDNVEIFDGLKNGDYVIKGNLNKYYQNQKVKLWLKKFLFYFLFWFYFFLFLKRIFIKLKSN